jgi:hypothetical protein
MYNYLALPTSSACVERLFNRGRDQIGIRRYRLSGDTLEHLMVLQYYQRKQREQATI